MPFGFQIVAELMELGGVFARQQDGAGAETVTEGVHAARSLTLGSLGAGRFLRVASIGLELFECCHSLILTNRAKLGGWGPNFLIREPTEPNLATNFSSPEIRVAERGGCSGEYSDINWLKLFVVNVKINFINL